LGADIDSGGDPSLRAFGRLNARLNTQAEASDAFRQAQMSSADRNQQFLQQLFAGPISAATTRRDPREPNPLLASLGGVASAYAGRPPK
jgi:hypothetical protein